MSNNQVSILIIVIKYCYILVQPKPWREYDATFIISKYLLDSADAF